LVVVAEQQAQADSIHQQEIIVLVVLVVLVDFLLAQSL